MEGAKEMKIFSLKTYEQNFDFLKQRNLFIKKLKQVPPRRIVHFYAI